VGIARSAIQTLDDVSERYQVPLVGHVTAQLEAVIRDADHRDEDRTDEQDTRERKVEDRDRQDLTLESQNGGNFIGRIVYGFLKPTTQACAKVLVVIGEAAGFDRFAAFQYFLFQLHKGFNSNSFVAERNYNYHYHLDEGGMTAMVVSYSNKDLVISSSTCRKLHQIMHHEVDLRPFEATVKVPEALHNRVLGNDGRNELPSQVDHGVESSPQQQKQSLESGQHACTPLSFPPSPRERSQVMATFSSFANDVVYRARDVLRRESREGTASNPLHAMFNAEDSHMDLCFSCGDHSVSVSKVRQSGAAVYRTVRSILPIQKDRTVYFQMKVSALPPYAHTACCGADADDDEDFDDSNVVICMGLSTRAMHHEVMVGNWNHSIGLHSSGYVVKNSKCYAFQQQEARNARYHWGDIVGILVKVQEHNRLSVARMHFLINGRCLNPDSPLIVEGVAAELYPTVSIYSKNSLVTGHFCEADIQAVPTILRHVGNDAECLDGSLLFPSAADEQSNHQQHQHQQNQQQLWHN